MNTHTHNTAAAIQLNDTFARLLTGAATVGDILKERAQARATKLAGEDALARRRREWAEARDYFFQTCTF